MGRPRRAEDVGRERLEARRLFRSRYRAVDKERASLEALRRISRKDTDRPSLALYFALEAFKWGGAVTALYLFLRFMAEYFELL